MEDRNKLKVKSSKVSDEIKKKRDKLKKEEDFFGYDENYFIVPDENFNKVGVDGDYLISLMPKSEKINKLELLDELYERFCNISECEAEKGNKSCIFDVEDNYPCYGIFDPKEMAILLYQKITCKPGLTGYADKINESLYRLYVTWHPSNQEEIDNQTISTRSILNKSNISSKSNVLNKSNITTKSNGSNKSILKDKKQLNKSIEATPISSNKMISQNSVSKILSIKKK